MAGWPNPWREVVAWARRRRHGPIHPQRIRLTLLAKLRGVEEADVQLLRELVVSGQALETLMQSTGWSTFLALKDELQSIATEKSRGPSSTEQERQNGAVAFWAIEGLFGTAYRTIRNGQKAREVLRQSVTSGA